MIKKNDVEKLNKLKLYLDSINARVGRYITYDEFSSDEYISQQASKLREKIKKSEVFADLRFCGYTHTITDNQSDGYQIEHIRPKSEYCERFVDVRSRLVVSSFREKLRQNSLIVDDHIPEYDNDRNGYWFLAFDFFNLYVAGPNVNKVKSNLYPLRHDSKRALPNNNDISGEYPFIMGPLEINRDNFVVKKNGVIIPKDSCYVSAELTVEENFIQNWQYIRQIATIHLLKLNGQNLEYDRKMHYFTIEKLLKEDKIRDLVRILLTGKFKIASYYAIYNSQHRLSQVIIDRYFL